MRPSPWISATWMGTVNTPPEVKLIGPTNANRISPVTFDGSGSTDAEGDPLTFQWYIDGTLAGTGSTLTTTFAELGSHTVSLTVDDGAASATISKGVSVQNLNPSVDAGPAQVVQQKTAVSLAGAGSDPDGTIASYHWEQISGPVVALQGVNASSATFVAPSLGKKKSEALMFRLQVIDNDGGVASATTTVTVVKR